MAEIFKNFKIEHWYQAVTALSAVILVMSLTMSLHIDNKAVALLALGSLLIGIGEWINHPGRFHLNPQTGIHFTDNKRFNKPGGNLLDVIGLICIVVGAYRLL